METKRRQLNAKKPKKSFFDQVMTGLQQAHDFENGNTNGTRLRIIEIAPLPEYTADVIKGIRNRLEMTQVTFAAFMGVSKKTIEAWEAGRNKPEGPACRILELIEKDEEVVKKHLITN